MRISSLASVVRGTQVFVWVSAVLELTRTVEDAAMNFRQRKIFGPVRCGSFIRRNYIKHAVAHLLYIDIVPCGDVATVKSPGSKVNIKVGYTSPRRYDG